MKKGIHPNYGPAVIKCACGNKVKTQAVVDELNVEICSACHPFYTGKKKIVDSTGRVDRFMKRFQKSEAMKKEAKPKTKPKKKKKAKTVKSK
jgi:large subunit ribosomal protein L31